MSLQKDNLAGKAADIAAGVEWVPARCGDIMEKSIRNAQNWCISRQRYWGIPLTILTCEKCRTILVNPDVSRRIVESVRSYGSEAWFTGETQQWIESGTECESCGHSVFVREHSMMDVWLESGMSHRAVLTSDNGLSWPASLYLEGFDQLKGWFRSSLITAVASQDKAPFDSVLVHGFVLDGYGGKMSKSAGNMLFPRDLVKEYGADILRFWLASVNYTENIPFSKDDLDRTAEKYRWMRQSFGSMLDSISDFNPKTDATPYQDMLDIDKYFLIAWTDVLEELTSAYSVYAFHHVIRIVEKFIRDILKSEFWRIYHHRLQEDISVQAMKRSGQTAICLVINELVRSLAPVLVFAAEELWYYVPGTEGSVHRQDFPSAQEPTDAESIRINWHGILEIRNMVFSQLSEVHTLDNRDELKLKKLSITCSELRYRKLKSLPSELLTVIFGFSQVDVRSAINAEFRDDTHLELLIT